MWAQLQAVRGGFSPWGATWPADGEEWDESGERRLNVPDSDLSFEFEPDALPCELYDKKLGITADLGASSRARETEIQKVGNRGRERGVEKETGVLGLESDESKKAVSGEQLAMSDVGGDEEELVLQDVEDFDVATKMLEDEKSPLLQFVQEQSKKLRAASSGEHSAGDGERLGEGGGRREKGDVKGRETGKIVVGAGGGMRQRIRNPTFYLPGDVRDAQGMGVDALYVDKHSSDEEDSGVRREMGTQSVKGDLEIDLFRNKRDLLTT
jgi:hypothetical protein